LRSRWFQASRGALVCAGLIALCAPVALATPPEEPPVAEAPPAVEAPPSDSAPIEAPPPVEAAPVEAPPGVEVAPIETPAAVEAPSDEAPPVEPAPAAGPVEQPRDEGAAIETPAPREEARDEPPAIAPPPAVARSATAAGVQPPPEEEPAEPPADVAPEPPLPPSSDPSCVFPQPVPGYAEQCEVLQSECTVLGTPGADTLIGGATADLICGLGGDDDIDAGDGDDVVLGGDGNDRIHGGAGFDCLAGQAGEDEFVDADEDWAIQDGELGEIEEGEVGVKTLRLADDGSCQPGRVADTTPEPSGNYGSSGGSVSATVDTASVVYELARLLDESAGEGLPIDVAPTARVRDGVALLLLRCPDADLEGEIVLLEQHGDREVRAGRGQFTCEPPSDPVEVRLTDAALGRIEDRGRIAVTVRIAAEGYSAEHEERITIRGGT
jgi:hypothetical protein